MSRYEVILAACCGDTEQADLVLDVLARRVTTSRTFCPTCLHELDEAAYCTCCGHLENNPARAAEPVRAARREPEKGG